MAKIEVQAGANGAVTFWLDNPAKHNALTESMLANLVSGIQHQAALPGTRLIVIRGRQGIFCAGRDVSDLQTRAPQAKHSATEQVRPAKQLANTLLNCPVPTVAAVSGRAIGLGLGIVVWCDLAIADESASFSVPEARLGIPPSMTAWSLAHVVGVRSAADWVLRGRTVRAQEAWHCGLVPRPCQDEADLSRVLEVIAQDVRRCGPAALRASKALMRELDGQAFMQGLEHATRVAADSLASDEAVEGMRAFREKRPPMWMI